MSHRRTSSGSPFEPVIGFSRAVRSGPMIVIAGTAPIGMDGQTASPGDAYGQAQRCLAFIIAAVREAGGRPEDIIRTRIYLKDIADWPLAAKAPGEVFAGIRPACTCLEVSGFIAPDWLVEIEADAWVIED